MANVLLALAMNQYDRARAKLTALVGQFYTYRERILKMQDRADYVARKADRNGNAAALEAARQVSARIHAAYNKQIQLEGQVEGAMSKIAAVSAGAQSQGLGADPQPGSLISAAGSLVSTAAAIIVHQREIDALESVLRQLESKTLTAAEAAQLRAGGVGGFGTFGAIAVVGIGFLAFKLFRRRRA